MIFVFGSNTAGRHGKGAALTALKFHGAVYGIAEGLMGNSYALPTCNNRFRALPIDLVKHNVSVFTSHAASHPELTYKVTRIGCGLAGLSDKEITPFFQGAPNNCLFDTKWQPWLGQEVKYWGTF